MRRRVVITGMGVVAATGIGLASFEQSVFEGKTGIGPLTLFDPEPYRTKIVGEVPGFDPTDYMEQRAARYMDRLTQLAMVAAEESVGNAGEALNNDSGIVFGTGIGGIATADKQHHALSTIGPKTIKPMDIPMIMCNSTASYLSMKYGLRGQGYTVVTACSSGSNAIGEAYRLIKHGYADTVLTGGTDASISPGIFHAWCKLRVLSKRNDTPESACRPFSKDRDGMVLAEGAAVLVMEELEHARNRGATIYGEIAGYGSSYDASHITAPSVEGQTLAATRAIQDAGLSPEDIDHVNAHGTGTKLNDSVETKTIKQALGKHAYNIPITSIKAVTGHTLGAAGALECVASCLTLQKNTIPPTLNYSEPDPECDLNLVTHTAREAEVNTIMSNTFGFGGNNAVLIIKRV